MVIPLGNIPRVGKGSLPFPITPLTLRVLLTTTLSQREGAVDITAIKHLRTTYLALRSEESI